MTKRVILGGGNSWEAVKNTQNKGKFDVKPNKPSCLFVLDENNKISEEKNLIDKNWATDDVSGGQIVFSVAVNSKMFADEAGKNKLLQAFSTVTNKSFIKKVLDKIRRKQDVYAWTIGKYFVGRYTGKRNNKIYNERSLVIDCMGLTYKELFKLAEELMNLFNQESVLVKYYKQISVVSR